MGICHAKRALNALHHWMGTEDFSEVYVERLSDGFVSITRHCPRSHESVVLVAHNRFETKKAPSLGPTLNIEGNLEVTDGFFPFCHTLRRAFFFYYCRK